MSKYLYVRPGFEGAVLRDPATGVPLPPEGKRVADTPFWRRRLRSGDAIPQVEGDPTAAPGEPAVALAPPTKRSSK